MAKVAIVGTGPTGIYTFYSLLKSDQPMSISLYEKEAEAGVGMPYSEDHNSRMMLANIASIEITPIGCTYLQWLKTQEPEFFQRFNVDKESLHERQFLPRILLGKFFRDRFLALVVSAKNKGVDIHVHESCVVTDIAASARGVELWREGSSEPESFDFVVIATGHVWPEDQPGAHFFPSPWTGLLKTAVPAGTTGIMGTSLSAIDAVMAVAMQHGDFVRDSRGVLRFELDESSSDLEIVMMSRTGILPEAEFYYPIPYEPLRVATPARIRSEIERGATALLARVFQLMVEEIALADSQWATRINLRSLTADTFADAYFRDRKRFDPFSWAEYNLDEVEKNRHQRRVVGWRYAILRLHEAVQEVVPYLDEQDREIFQDGLQKVFVDNYAAIPPESIRRLLALREAGVVSIVALGDDYHLDVQEHQTCVIAGEQQYLFGVFIDARGQRPLTTRDLPFPRLRAQLLDEGDEGPALAPDYTLLSPSQARGRIALAAMPYLMRDKPFVQGLDASAAIGKAVASAVRFFG